MSKEASRFSLEANISTTKSQQKSNNSTRKPKNSKFLFLNPKKYKDISAVYD